jgi:hypothetical protein
MTACANPDCPQRGIELDTTTGHPDLPTYCGTCGQRIGEANPFHTTDDIDHIRGGTDG